MANILTSLIARQAAKYPAQREALFYPADDRWLPITWQEFARQTARTAQALCSAGIEPQQTLAIFSQNRPEVLMTDFGAYANRAVPVSIYATSSLEQVEYIINDSGASILFVGEEQMLPTVLKALPHCPRLRLIVTYDDSSAPDGTPGADKVIAFSDFLRQGESDQAKCTVERRTAEAREDDVATIVYTSGTTGEPKGAVLLHRGLNFTLPAHWKRIPTLSDRDTSVCFLPLSHIFEKGWTYMCLYVGIKIYINYDPHVIQQTVATCRPTCMSSVPRFWEKVYTAIQDKVSRMSPMKRRVVDFALRTGRRYNLDYVRTGRKAPLWLRMRWNLSRRLVFDPMTKVIGIENGHCFPTAGAPLSNKITEFFHCCGVNLVIGYGLSETTATVSCYPEYDYRIGTVGTPLPGIEVKLGPDNEILVKGPTVMRDYLGKPQATAEAFTANGWFRTGDAGMIDDSGAIILTERIKDLFKSSNGKYIAPQALESRIGEDPMIEQVAVIGDQRKFVSALIVPDYSKLRKYAEENGIAFTDNNDLVLNHDIRKMMARRIEALQQDFAGHERIKRFILLPRPFTIESGELTNTLKVKRPVIASKYADEIESMYQ